MSDTTDGYATRPELWRPIADAVDGFDLDAASGAEPTPIAEDRLTAEDNGLAHDWYGDVWLNPPFSLKTEFYKKTLAEVERDAVTRVVALAPVDTSTQWFHNQFSKSSAICWLEGRDWYIADGSPSFNTAVGVFGPADDDLLATLSSLGAVTEPRQDHTQTRLGDPND